jgi:endoglucanase
LFRSTSLVSLSFLLAFGGCSILIPGEGGGSTSQSQDGGAADGGESGFVTHAIRVDTVGYLPDRAKVATVVLPTGMSSLTNANAEVRAVSDDSVVWPCELKGPATDPDTGVTYYTADFSSFTTEGAYYLSAPGLLVGGVPARSAPFKVDAHVFGDLLNKAMISFYGQRCGTAIEIKIDSNVWKHGECHKKDAYQKYLPPLYENSIKPSLRGWHDAGDYGKYVTNGAFAAGMLLQAWERFQPGLSALSLAIPEHGGKIPDFLAEVKWELDWLLTTQRDDGAVSFKVTELMFGGFVAPDADGVARYFTDVNDSAADNFVALMAQASRVFQPYDEALAATYLEVARKSYTFVSGQTSAYTTDVKAFSTGDYDVARSDGDNRLWAAAEMWETTGEAPFLAYFETKAATVAVTDIFDWDNLANMAVFTYLNSKREGRSADLVAALTAKVVASADTLTAKADASAFGRAISGYYWGSNGGVARASLNLATAAQLNPTSADKYRDTIAKQLDHLLGRNYYDRSQVTMVGYNPPRNIHHRPSISDKSFNPYPGLLVGGTGGKDNKATTWVDEIGDGSSNEVAVNWNAPLVYAAAALTPAP